MGCSSNNANGTAAILLFPLALQRRVCKVVESSSDIISSTLFPLSIKGQTVFISFLQGKSPSVMKVHHMLPNEASIVISSQACSFRNREETGKVTWPNSRGKFYLHPFKSGLLHVFVGFSTELCPGGAIRCSKFHIHLHAAYDQLDPVCLWPFTNL